MRSTESNELVDVSRSVLQCSEDMLILLRDACAEIVAGERTVTRADVQELARTCDAAIAQTKAVRARFELVTRDVSPRVM